MKLLRNVIVPTCAFALFAACLWFVVSRGIESPGNSWKYSDLITVLLTAISALLAVLGIIIAILALWGYRTIRQASEEQARHTARRVAKQEMAAFLDSLGYDAYRSAKQEKVRQRLKSEVPAYAGRSTVSTSDFAPELPTEEKPR